MQEDANAWIRIREPRFIPVLVDRFHCFIPFSFLFFFFFQETDFLREKVDLESVAVDYQYSIKSLLCEHPLCAQCIFNCSIIHKCTECVFLFDSAFAVFYREDIRVVTLEG